MSVTQSSSINVRNFEPFLRKCLHCEELELIDFSATRMLPLGENYSSLILKIDATVRRGKGAADETLRFVAKTPSDSSLRISEWANVLKPEVFVYAELAAAYEEIDEAARLEKLKFYPKYVGHRYSLDDEKDLVDEHSMLLLENLIPRGYYVAKKSVGLNVEHAKVALTSLARFHALGVALKKARPDLIEKRTRLLLEGNYDFQVLDYGFDTVLKTIRENDHLTKHLQAIEATFAASKNGQMWFKPVNEPWGTMIHGDFWVNNMLFRRDDSGCVDDVKLVDFQGSYYNSPLKDLPRFLCNSLDAVSQAHHMDELVGFYYDTFTKWIERYGCDSKVYTREGFDEELKRQAVNEFPLVAFCLKFLDVSVDDEQNRDFATEMFAAEMSDQVVGKLRRLIEIYEEKNWFTD